MNKLMKKRQLILAGLVLALAAAVFVNWYYTKPNTTPVSGKETVTKDADSKTPGEAEFVNSSDVGNSSDYFASVRLQRDTARDAALNNIKSVMANISAQDSESVQQANAGLGELSENIKLESDIEALVSAKTGTECVAVINDDSIQIVVPKDIINETSVLQITEIVLDNTDIKSDNIKIIGAE